MDRTTSPFLSRKEFAEIARVSLITVDRWMRDGRLPFTKIGGRVLISRAVIDSMLAAAAPLPEVAK